MRTLAVLAAVVITLALSACCGDNMGGDCSDHGGVDHKDGQYSYCKDGTAFGPTGELGGGG